MGAGAPPTWRVMGGRRPATARGSEAGDAGCSSGRALLCPWVMDGLFPEAGCSWACPEAAALVGAGSGPEARGFSKTSAFSDTSLFSEPRVFPGAGSFSEMLAFSERDLFPETVLFSNTAIFSNTDTFSGPGDLSETETSSESGLLSGHVFPGAAGFSEPHFLPPDGSLPALSSSRAPEPHRSRLSVR